MKQSPFPNLNALLRVLVKALIIVTTANLVLLGTGANPIRVLTRLNTFDLMGRGRPRLAYPSDFQNGQLPLESLLAAHTISAPKGADEYRIVLLGESGIAGWGLDDDVTLSAQLTARGIRVGDRRVVAYNLAYPQPSAARDLLILDAAMAYQPDLIIWFITPAAVDNSPDLIGTNRLFFDLNRQRFEWLVAEYAPLLSGWYAGRVDELFGERPVWQRYSAIQDQDLLPVWLNSLFYPVIPPDLAKSDRRIGREDVPAEARYADNSPGFETLPNESWQFLRAGCLRAAAGGAHVLLVNEPMLVGSGPHSDVNYNGNYQRVLYDRYRAILANFVEAYDFWYADLWNVIPPERFTDTPLHADAEGYGILTSALEPIIAKGNEGLSCR